MPVFLPLFVLVFLLKLVVMIVLVLVQCMSACPCAYTLYIVCVLGLVPAQISIRLLFTAATVNTSISHRLPNTILSRRKR